VRFREGSWKVHGRFMEGAWKVHGRFMEGSWKVHGRFREGSGNLNHSKGASVSALVERRAQREMVHTCALSV